VRNNAPRQLRTVRSRIVRCCARVASRANGITSDARGSCAAVSQATILMVGATGLLGRDICRRLGAAGKPVRALVRRTADRAKNGPWRTTWSRAAWPTRFSRPRPRLRRRKRAGPDLRIGNESHQLDQSGRRGPIRRPHPRSPRGTERDSRIRRSGSDQSARGGPRLRADRRTTVHRGARPRRGTARAGLPKLED